jgi:hypothetical protein
MAGSVLGSEGFVILTPPSVEPVTLSDVKDWLNIDFSSKDTLGTLLIKRARRRCETITGRAFASQQIQCTFPITRPQGGELSGPVDHGPNWYSYQEQLGANPFGASMFYFMLPMAPIDTTQACAVETKITAFQTWNSFYAGLPPTISTTSVWVDTNQEPATFYFSSPQTANFWRFTFWCGYGSNTFPLPEDLMEPLMELVSYWYDYRDGGGDKNRLDQIESKLLSKRLSSAWI